MTDIILFVLIFVGWLAFAMKRALTYMHAFQQDEYDGKRFLMWIYANRVFDRNLSALILAISILAMFVPPFVSGFMLFTAMVGIAYLEKDPRKKSKKKLAVTERVKRILGVAAGFLALSGVACLFIPSPLIWIAAVHLVPLWLVAANRLLRRYEDRIQQGFWDEAHEKITSLNPTVIGITGSFGKTSVKHILGHILKNHAPTLITPGSVNTPMGIARIVREQLDERHDYFIAEMGAYGPGSIERLCRLTPPDIGIITAIGHAHYERFKTLETVAEAKYELAESVLGKRGKVIVQDRTLRFENARAMRISNPERFIVCGEDTEFLQPGDLKVERVVQRPEGLEIDIRWKDTAYALDVPLYGVHHGQNAAMAFAAAVTLGLDPESVTRALRSVPQIEHRLEVKKFADGSTIIDDAYNSNPIGFVSALGLLATLGAEGRKILITPGMVELGTAHDEAHEKIGKTAGQVCDVIIVVAASRIPTFIAGIKSTGKDKQIIEVASFQEASAWAQHNRDKGDVILIENDLPDIYERVPRL